MRATAGPSDPDRVLLSGVDGVDFYAVHASAGWGITSESDGGRVFTQACPVRIEIGSGDSGVRTLIGGYHDFGPGPVIDSWIGRGVLVLKSAEIRFEDQLRPSAAGLELDRTVTVHGNAEGGFGSGFVVEVAGATGWPAIRPFFPGVIYGSGDAVAPDAFASPQAYRAGVREVRIRADRLPLPLFGLWRAGGHSVAILDAKPDGSTTVADCWDVDPDGRPVVDPGFRFSALAAAEVEGRFTAGIWFPGSEGEQTYPHPRRLLHWRRRFHPVRDGLRQQYRVAVRVGREPDDVSFRTAAWRWAWKILAPRSRPVDIEVARQSLVAMLAANTSTADGITGIPLAIDSVTGRTYDVPRLMGFTGRNTDAAYHLLLEANRRPLRPESVQYRRLGTSICDDFVRLRMNPPQAEGFRDGKPFVWTYLGRPNLLYLRPMCEGAKSVLQCGRIERDSKRDHPQWIRWAVSFGNWLIEGQQPDGSFPRAWEAGTGKVGDSSKRSTYNAIPLLTLLAAETGEARFTGAAERAGEFAWNDGQRSGTFVGGTIDNPNVIDKEAGTLSLSAYLALLEATGDPKWLPRAKLAADFAGTWIYGWNVPMPVDAPDSQLHWKRGADTTGVQLISTGHSFVDQYMAFEVGNYLKLFGHTGDPHYQEVAGILLHGTKAMLAMPGRQFDLVGPGWQQEHWSLSVRRGIGGHRLWLPWVSVAHLEGITQAEAFDPKLFAKLSSPS